MSHSFRLPLWLRVGARVCRHLPLGRYHVASWLARRVTQPFVARFPEGLSKARFECDPRDAMAAQVYFAGVYEPQETAVVQAVLSSGARFVDVGANWGYHTLMAAAWVGAGGSVIAIEPEPRMCAALRENIALNALSNVTVVEMAAVECDGTVPLLPFDAGAGNYGISRVAAGNTSQASSIAVTGRALDDLLAELGIRRVSLLKMDIEGGEARALAGLRRSLEAGIVERLLLELHPQQLKDCGSSANEVFELLTAAGLYGWTLDHSPRASRRAAYARRLNARDYVRPFRLGQPLDAWPHLLWSRQRDKPF